MAKMQMEVERQRKKNSPISDMVRPQHQSNSHFLTARARTTRSTISSTIFQGHAILHVTFLTNLCECAFWFECFVWMLLICVIIFQISLPKSCSGHRRLSRSLLSRINLAELNAIHASLTQEVKSTSLQVIVVFIHFTGLKEVVGYSYAINKPKRATETVQNLLKDPKKHLWPEIWPSDFSIIGCIFQSWTRI